MYVCDKFMLINFDWGVLARSSLLPAFKLHTPFLFTFPPALTSTARRLLAPPRAAPSRPPPLCAGFRALTSHASANDAPFALLRSLQGVEAVGCRVLSLGSQALLRIARNVEQALRDRRTWQAGSLPMPNAACHPTLRKQPPLNLERR